MWKSLKKLVYVSYVIALLAFTIWYGNFMYPLIFGFETKTLGAAISFRAKEAKPNKGEQLFSDLVKETRKTTTTHLGDKVLEQPYIEGRFHHIGFEIDPDKVSICVRCHGDVPHDQSKEVRSFLNMHAFYLACETCHIQPKEGEHAWEFRWYDKATGEIAPNPPVLVENDNVILEPEGRKIEHATFGNYGAKIAPGKLAGIEQAYQFKFLNRERIIGFVDKYIQEQAQLDSVHKSQAKKIIHKNVNKKPLECESCHNADKPYLPFAELGYPPRQVDELTTSATVGMIKKYKQFWMPSLLNPGVGHDDK